ncbi:MAG: hypothetical protein ACOX6Q_02380 [Candidatus Dojkabacteria bacterium]|jgi:hypothetical protein
MLRSRKVKLILSSLFAFILLFPPIIYVVVRERAESVKGLSNSLISEPLVESRVPYIYSLAPLSVVAGKEYVYIPKFADSDSSFSDLKLTLVESPSWLHLKNGVVGGFAPVDSVSKTYKFVIRISDGYNSSDQENYIVVLEDE